ncbi:MAG TPA: adenylate/guanylate cyclase domain-containing protein [Acidimicrobiia bacterium]|nr:adenylate/guanylate cyclase domain-containing protein [Acidimicrobiia bacterium]
MQSITAGREAYGRNSWEEAYQELKSADGSDDFDPDDLVLLADAAWFSGRVEESTQTLERAYLGYVDEGAPDSAAVIAIRLVERAFRAGEAPIAQGWLARAERLIEDLPESGVHAWVATMKGAKALLADGDAAAAIGELEQAIELGRLHRDPDVEAVALSFKGTALTRLGRVEEGLALLDAATAAATSGELRVKTACDVYCLTISACHDLSDLRRSAEWTERAERHMQQGSVSGYPGACKVHRAELKRYQGKWAEAEEEARAACEELERFRLLDILGSAYNEIGEVRLRMGDLAEAEAAFVKAYEYGWDPQPGLSLLHLARGNAAEAASSLERSLSRGQDHAGFDLVHLVHNLPAKVEIDLARGDLEGARAATEELERIATEHDNRVWSAAAGTARGKTELFEGQVDQALHHLDRAWRSWRDLDFPYESAMTRTSLAEARRAAGDETGARLELNAALASFRDLGAKLGVQRVNELLEDNAQREATLATMTFMFTDIVTSTDLIGLIGDEAWASLLGWHDRTLEAEFTGHGGNVVNHTGDGFFVAFSDVGPAIDCAVDIQRSLRTHRREHGFAPSIRIGIHAADATSTDGGFTGRGVHVAARIGAEAGADEILVSESTLAAVSGLEYPVSEARSLSLKGISTPVEASTVDWR